MQQFCKLQRTVQFCYGALERAGNVRIFHTRRDHHIRLTWGISTVGSAPALQAGSQEFESPILHEFVTQLCHSFLKLIVL